MSSFKDMLELNGVVGQEVGSIKDLIKLAKGSGIPPVIYLDIETNILYIPSTFKFAHSDILLIRYLKLERELNAEFFVYDVDFTRGQSTLVEFPAVVLPLIEDVQRAVIPVIRCNSLQGMDRVFTD